MEYFDLLTEKANPNPKKFWLVLSMNEDSPETAEQLSKGVLHGLKGISASREIVGNFFHTSGNACLVMDPNEVMRDNDIEMIDYHDVDYLLSRNMKVLHRLFNKSIDKFGKRQILQTIFSEFSRYIRDLNHPEFHIFDYYGFPSKMSHIHDGQDISSVTDLVTFAEEAFNEVKNKERFPDMDISPDLFRDGLISSVLKTAQWYEDESEWIVNSDTFNIPIKSTLLITKSDIVDQRYDEWKLNKDSFSFGPIKWRMISYEAIIDQIEKYQLDKRYKVRFVSEERFASIIDKTKARRRERKRGY